MRHYVVNMKADDFLNILIRLYKRGTEAGIKQTPAEYLKTSGCQYYMLTSNHLYRRGLVQQKRINGEKKTYWIGPYPTVKIADEILESVRKDIIKVIEKNQKRDQDCGCVRKRKVGLIRRLIQEVRINGIW